MELLLFQDKLNKIDKTSNKTVRCILKNEIKFPTAKLWSIMIKIKYFITISNSLPVSQLSNDIFNSDVFLFTLVFEDENGIKKAKWNSRRKKNNGYITREVGQGKLPETYQDR